MATSTPSSTLRGAAPAANETVVHPHARGWWPALLGSIPNVLAFGLLAAVFYTGHATGWKLPKFSALGGVAPAAGDDWCDEHSVAESTCLECQPALKPKLPSFGWCERHGVNECVICHPELAQTKEQPQPPAYDTAAAIGVRPRAQNNSVNTLHTKIVQFSSAEAIERAGVEVDVVGAAPMREEITAHGEVNFDPTRVAHLSSRASGTVWQVLKQVGQPVAAGEALALVEAATVGQAKTQLLQAASDLRTATARLDRLKGLGDAVAGRSVIEAEAALREAEIGLVSAEQALVNLGFMLPKDLARTEPKQLAEDVRFLGVPDGLASSLASQTQTTNLFPLVSPIAGVLVSAHAVQGESVDADHEVFVVADPSRLTLILSVRQEDAALVALGQEVRFTTDDGAASTDGQIDWISPVVEPKSRTLPVRVSVTNPGGKLRDNTFGMGRILLRAEPRAIVVPASAVHSAGDVQLVFVRDKNYFSEGAAKFFHVRQVRIGARDDKQVELLAGVLPGEVVATEGSNVLLAQLLRGTLGGGEHGHHH